METEFLIQSWEEAYDACMFLFEQVKRSGYEPDVIVGIARGGWIPARLLSDFFTNSFTANIKIELYKGIGVHDHQPRVTQEMPTIIKNKKVLLVDDVADTGHSLRVAIEHARKKGAAEIRTATIFYKPHSIIKPDYYVRETTAWVVYAWERFEFIKEMHQKLSSEGKSLDETKDFLKQVGIPPGVVEAYYATWE